MVKKYEDIDNLFDDNKESDLYIEYSCIKQNLGDISVAISKLEELCKVAINLLGKESEDFKFLISEKNKLIKIKKNIETNKNKLKIQINSLSKIEKEKLLNVSDPKITSTIKRYRKYADEIDNMKESISDILKIINEKLSAFYSFFVPKIKTIPIFSGYQVDFDVSKQEISVKSGVSEGQIILLRIISSIFTNVFSQQYKGKISNVAFYDSTFEPIDEDSGKELFDILNNLYSDETIKKYLPQLFIFIVGKKDLFGLQKMNNIKYSNKGFLS
ncbi:MAG TPA: hypothetical protein VJ892_02070 [Candidatus Absconditabacterales bacterium]|nr:hypothetical protein [Candidatus Absconditabacterales bacterium]